MNALNNVYKLIRSFGFLKGKTIRNFYESGLSVGQFIIYEIICLKNYFIFVKVRYWLFKLILKMAELFLMETVLEN